MFVPCIGPGTDAIVDPSGEAFGNASLAWIIMKGADFMPLRLNVGASQKVSDERYGSRGASVNLEIELDSALALDPAKLQERVRQLFALVRQSVSEELAKRNSGSENASAP